MCHYARVINFRIIIIIIIIIIILFFLFFIFLAHQHKACRREYETKQCSNGFNDILFGRQCVLEGDRMPSLKSHYYYN